MTAPTPEEVARFVAGAHRYAAEVFRSSPFEAQRRFAPVLNQWAANAERRAMPVTSPIYSKSRPMDDDLKAVVAELERLAKAALEPVLVGAEKAAHMRQREYRFAANPSTVLRLISALRQRDEVLRECADVFEHYAELHRQKFTGEMTDAETSAIAAKVKRNADMARKARAILTGSETNAR